MAFTRRDFVDRAFKGSVLALSFEIGGATLLLSPKEARAQNVPLRNLDSEQARRLELLAETILPGATEAGVVHFVDHQLGEDPNNALLLAKYFNVRPPYSNFYGAGLNVADGMAQESMNKSLEELSDSELHQLVRAMSAPDAIVNGFPAICYQDNANNDVSYVRATDSTGSAWGTPVAFGPFTQDFQSAAEDLVSSGGGFRIQSIDELAELIVILARQDPV